DRAFATLPLDNSARCAVAMPGWLGTLRAPEAARWTANLGMDALLTGATTAAATKILCDLLREIFGNPFRPVTVNSTWLTSNVISLAQTIYDERAFDRMPILADALEDAGCTNAEILQHCRQPGEHVRGCWVVDLLLGKE